MKYYLDTEFIEGSQSRTFLGINIGETKPTIDLISIGIVAEDGREYYAISKDFNLKEAWNRYQEEEQTSFEKYHQFSGRKVYWLRENVLKPIFRELLYKGHKEANLFLPEVNPKQFTYKNLKKLISAYGKTNKEIAREIQNFVYLEVLDKGGQFLLGNFIPNESPKPEFYAYYADYDWVVFCWLFGKMIDLPQGFPMYCKDLKQMLDEKGEKLKNGNGIMLKGSYVESVKSFEAFHFKSIKDIPDYPKQDNTKAHSAIEDARWNKEFHEFLLKL